MKMDTLKSGCKTSLANQIQSIETKVKTPLTKRNVEIVSSTLHATVDDSGNTENKVDNFDTKNEVPDKSTESIIDTKNETEFAKRSEEVKDDSLSESDSDNEEEEEKTEDKEDAKPPSVEVCDVEAQLGKLHLSETTEIEDKLGDLAISGTGDTKTKGKLCARSPMRTPHSRPTVSPYAFSSQGLQAGGHMLARIIADNDLPDVGFSADEPYNIVDSPESNNNWLLQSSPPISEESLSPPQAVQLSDFSASSPEVALLQEQDQISLQELQAGGRILAEILADSDLPDVGFSPDAPCNIVDSPESNNNQLPPSGSEDLPSPPQAVELPDDLQGVDLFNEQDFLMSFLEELPSNVIDEVCQPSPVIPESVAALNGDLQHSSTDISIQQAEPSRANSSTLSCDTWRTFTPAFSTPSPSLDGNISDSSLGSPASSTSSQNVAYTADSESEEFQNLLSDMNYTHLTTSQPVNTVPDNRMSSTSGVVIIEGNGNFLCSEQSSQQPQTGTLFVQQGYTSQSVSPPTNQQIHLAPNVMSQIIQQRFQTQYISPPVQQVSEVPQIFQQRLLPENLLSSFQQTSGGQNVLPQAAQQRVHVQNISPLTRQVTVPQNISPLTRQVTVPQNISPLTRQVTVPQNISPLTRQVTVPQNISPLTRQVTVPQNISPFTRQITVPQNISPPTRQVTVPQNIPPFTRQITVPQNISPPTRQVTVPQNIPPFARQITVPQNISPDIQPGTFIQNTSSLVQQTPVVQIVTSPIQHIPNQNSPLLNQQGHIVPQVPGGVQNLPPPQDPKRPVLIQAPLVPRTVRASAGERLAKKVEDSLGVGARNSALVKLTQVGIQSLITPDYQGDTQLMIMIVNEVRNQLAYIFVLINMMKNMPEALESKNRQDHSALYLACIHLPNEPLVARFIAETLLEKGRSVNEIYGKGNTLLHILGALGDSHLGVMVELLSMRDTMDRPCFNVNQHNHKEGTPLHIAIKRHSQRNNCATTIAFLLQEGANALNKERCSGQTALHMAVKESCDPLVIQILLQDAQSKGTILVNVADYPGDMPLHHAALRHDIPLTQQFRTIQLLMRYGAVSNRVGSQGRMPLALVSTDRKSEMQRIIRRR